MGPMHRSGLRLFLVQGKKIMTNEEENTRKLARNRGVVDTVTYLLRSVVAVVHGVARGVFNFASGGKHRDQTTAAALHEKTDPPRGEAGGGGGGGDKRSRSKVGDIKGFDQSPIDVGNIDHIVSSSTGTGQGKADPECDHQGSRKRRSIKVGKIKCYEQSPINVGNIVSGGTVGHEINAEETHHEVLGDIIGCDHIPINVGNITVIADDDDDDDIQTEVGDIICFDKSGIKVGNIRTIR